MSDERITEEAGGQSRGQAAAAPALGGDDLVQHVAARLEESIVFGHLHPRERLVEEELAARYAVKRHVVRQALLELEHLGLVERIRNRGAVVKLYEPQEVEGINAVRELLEGHAASLIPLPLPEAELAELRAIQARHAAAVEGGDRRAVFRENIAFHRAFFSHCANPSLIEAIEIFGQKSHAYRSIFVNDRDYLRWAASAHLQMIRAIEERDREGLVRLCVEHLAPAKDRYIASMRSRFP
jgi:DNA-binding GntR family transcriptional regulator